MKTSRSMKTALIPVLALFLGYRIYAMVGLSDSSEMQTASELVSLATRTLAMGQSASPSPEAATQWPSRSLDDVLQYDPFAKPVVAADPLEELVDASSEDADEVQPVPSAELKAIYRTRRGTVALIGSEVVREGERLRDGSLVVAIRDNSVLLRPAPVE